MIRRKFYDVEALVDSLEMQIGARDDLITRLTARVAELEGALEHTWKVLDAAGTLNLSNGVQLGPTVWYVKIEEAREMSRAALSQPAQPAPAAWRPIETPPPVGDQALYWTTKTEDDKPGYQLRFFPGVKCTHWMPLPPPPEKGE
jgi:hypothetical protein